MPNSISLPLLSQIQIASPCSARWEDMQGDAVTRDCAACKLQVHNLSEMTSEQAEGFLQARLGTGRVCARFYRRADGTILTRDCPVGIALWRKRAGVAVGRVAAAMLFLGTGGFVASTQQRESLTQRLRAVQPFRTVCEWVNPTVAPPPAKVVRMQVMGDICVLAPTVAPAARAASAGGPGR
ncbi:MAG: hypothetical protein AABZ53_12180 [Planctomycetota bacterium]